MVYKAALRTFGGSHREIVKKTVLIIRVIHQCNVLNFKMRISALQEHLLFG